MSHLSVIKTKMVDKVFLAAALKDLGYSVQEQKLDIKISSQTQGCTFSFRKICGFYQAVVDRALLKRKRIKPLVEAIAQRYAYHAARTKLEEQGFSIVEEKVEGENRIHLLLRRMA